MAKKRKHTRKPVAPDEVFQAGPMRIARYGANTVFQSSWPKDKYAEMQKRCIERLPALITEIDQLVMEIGAIVATLPPDKLLHRAWWQMTRAHLGIESEIDVGTDEMVTSRMVDYVQSVIAGMPPSNSAKDDVFEEDWGLLSIKVEELFGKINIEYPICQTMQNKTALDYDDSVEEFRHRARLHWCNIRGSRYKVHEPDYLRDVFSQHSAVFVELFGITSEEFISEILKIWKSLLFGLHESFTDFDSFRHESLDAITQKLSDDPSLSQRPPHELMALVVKENGWEERQASVFGRMLFMDLFDVQKVASLPESLLRELAWLPGEDTEFFAEGPFRGWPLRIWPIFKRPFLRVGDSYYCFDLYTLFDYIYRGMQRLILRLKPAYANTWRDIQQRVSEELPFSYLQKVLVGATVYRNIYYRWHPGAGQPKQWCEGDGVLVYDDHLFIVEARGGAFTYTPPETDFPAYVESLKNLVLKPATQGRRFLEYLESEEAVSIFDSAHQKIGELRRADFRVITLCPVTLDTFTECAAQVQHLRKIGVDVGSHPTWAISIDDLRAFADLFTNPLSFLHFVEQRRRAFESDIVQSNDELDHVGLYFAHNNYAMRARDIQSGGLDRVNFHGYRVGIDKFFAARLQNPEAPCPLVQETPYRLREIVEFLSNTVLRGRAQLGSYLLDLDGEWRGILAKSIEDELRLQPVNKSARPFSAHGGIDITAYCWTELHAQRNAALALDHVRAVMLVNDDRSRLLLELSYDAENRLAAANWQTVGVAGLSEAEMTRLRGLAENLRRNRLRNGKAKTGKIGRNEPCPCGSAKKYKKCCGQHP